MFLAVNFFKVEALPQSGCSKFWARCFLLCSTSIEILSELVLRNFHIVIRFTRLFSRLVLSVLSEASAHFACLRQQHQRLSRATPTSLYNGTWRTLDRMGGNRNWIWTSKRPGLKGILGLTWPLLLWTMVSYRHR